MQIWKLAASLSDIGGNYFLSLTFGGPEGNTNTQIKSLQKVVFSIMCLLKYLARSHKGLSLRVSHPESPLCVCEH